MIYDHILLAFFWILFGVLHSLLASTTIKAKLKQSGSSIVKHYRVYYVLFAFLSMVSIIWFQLSIPSPALFIKTTFTRIAGLVIAFAGLLIMGICIRKYFFSLSGLKALFIAHSQNELIITGIHKYIRHPLYLGTFIFIWGLFIFTPLLSLFIADLVITLYTLLAIKFEEAKLEAEFGEQYRSYKATVPKLLPFF